MNGNVTNRVARIMAGMANSTLTALAEECAQCVSGPNSRINMKPAITGETAKGKSITPLQCSAPKLLTHQHQRRHGAEDEIEHQHDEGDFSREGESM